MTTSLERVITSRPDCSEEISERTTILEGDPFETFTAPYTPDKSKGLLAYHQEVVRKYNLESPYYSFAAHPTPESNPSSEPALNYQRNLPEKFRVRAGYLYEFTPEELAVVIHEQVRAYLDQQTMGQNFPRSHPESVEELIAVMIDGFDPKTLTVICDFQNGNEFVPAAIVRAVVGKSSALVEEEVGNDRSDLSTFASLKFDPNLLPEHVRKTPCNQVACMGRIAYLGEVIRKHNLKSRIKNLPNSPASVVLEHLGKLMKKYNLLNPDQPIEIALADSHLERALQICQPFGLDIMVAAGNAQATDSIQETILRWHYGPEGYEDEIVVFQLTNFVN
jgi:hypothetical protein